MKFLVSSATLSKHLVALHGAIVSNPIIPILENFLFEIQKGKLKITASDLQTSIITELPLAVEGSTAIAIPARILLDTLKNLPEQPVNFDIDEAAYTVSITSSTGQYTLAGENATDFPKIPDITAKTAIDLPREVLKRAIQQTIIATSHDDLKPAINGIYMWFQEGGFTFVATDIHRLIRYSRQLVKTSEQVPFILPRKSLVLLQGLLPADEEAVQISFNNNNVHFQWADVKMVVRLIDEKYPDYKHVIPQNNPYKLTMDRMALLSSLRRIMIYTNKATHQVKLTLATDKVKILAEDLNFDNKAKEELPCDYTGEEGFEIGFNARSLMELLQNLQADEVSFYFSHPNKAAVIIPTLQVPDEDILLLIMPIAIY